MRPILLALVIVFCTLMPVSASSPARRAEKEKERVQKRNEYMEKVKQHNEHMQAMYIKYLKASKSKSQCKSGGCPYRK